MWSARATFDTDAAEVLDALTDPEMIAAWAPVRFEVEELDGRRLRAGSEARVSGSIAGVRATFDVEVTHADAQRLELVASGPLCFDVTYTFRQRASHVLVEARVGIRRRGGLGAQVMRAAAAALMSAGALSNALQRLDECLGREPAPELLAA